MSEKTVLVTLPVSVAVDAVQLRLQIVASDIELLAERPKRPSFAELEQTYNELFNLAYILKTIEEKENV